MWPFETHIIPTVPLDKVNVSYDYIIVGGGTAGCVLANRLTEDPDISVLLLERGKSTTSWSSRVPLLSCNIQTNGLSSITFNSVPQTQLENRAVGIVTGCGLGGTSRINTMLYTRGLPCQFDAWHKEGRKGWSYKELLPYFLQSEHALDETKSGTIHSVTGLWKNRTFNPYFKTADSVIRATMELGFPFITDVSNPSEPIYGIAKATYAIDENSRRCDTASAFLSSIPAASSSQGRPRDLHVCVDALVARVIFNPSKEIISVKGVLVRTQKNSEIEISAKKEVILCAGAIGTPQILMLSGIGPRDHLLGLGIDVHKDLPGVGESLQDHACIPVSFSVPIKDSLGNTMDQNPFTVLGQLFEYLTTGDGAFRAPIHEVYLWAKTDMLLFESTKILDERPSDPEDPSILPDIEIIATSFGDPSDDTIKGGFSFWAVSVKPQSRGNIRLTTTNPRDPPACNLNLLADSQDKSAARMAVKLCLRIKEQMVANGYPIIDHRVPQDDTDAGLDDFIAKRGHSLYHYSSSCRMAPENDVDGPGVVDDELRVHGISKLRIADASIFPNLLSTHPQAAVVAVAEKCADMVKKDRNPVA